MRLGEKVRHLRSVEGELRGLGRPLSKSEVVRAMGAELGEAISLPYLSQIERGTRPHLTLRTRDRLARFFHIHPGYLVDDPDGFEEGLGSLAAPTVENFAEWLALRADEIRDDPDAYEALLRLASAPDPRAVLLAVGRYLARRDSATQADPLDASLAGAGPLRTGGANE
ncbi:MAG TPA: helix-turn-helix transcriptional regulator [Chloroflexota bacterium]|nr:helix-turn-helix transcriptional regulator [Chloroflexota bacterium]